MTAQRIILCTGGIGSGKSVVCKAFSVMGFPVYDCDAAARELYDRDPRLLSDVASLAGSDIVSEGRLNRPLLASRIFADPHLLKKVEALVHPAVVRDFDRWRAASGAPAVVMESAILPERPLEGFVPDIIVAVSAPEDIRVERVCRRDGVAPEDVRKRLERQWSDAQRRAAADFEIDNSGLRPLLPQLEELLGRYSLQRPCGGADINNSNN